jgi:hypothetical protein
LTGKSSAHAFRFSHLGSSCHSVEAQVHHAKLEIKADLANDHGLEVTFKASLEELLTSALELAPGRLSVTHVTSALIVADIMVRPPGVFHGRRLNGHRVNEDYTAEEIVSQLEAKLQLDVSVVSNDLGARICKLAGATAGCTVAVTPLGTMAPLVHFGSKTPQDSEWPSNLMAVIVIIASAAVLCATSVIVVLFRRGTGKTSLGAARSQKHFHLQVESTQEIKVCSDQEKMQQPHQDCDDNASTATPTSLEEGLAELQNSSDLESRGEISTAVVAI